MKVITTTTTLITESCINPEWCMIILYSGERLRGEEVRRHAAAPDDIDIQNTPPCAVAVTPLICRHAAVWWWCRSMRARARMPRYALRRLTTLRFFFLRAAPRAARARRALRCAHTPRRIRRGARARAAIRYALRAPFKPWCQNILRYGAPRPRFVTHTARKHRLIRYLKPLARHAFFAPPPQLMITSDARARRAARMHARRRAIMRITRAPRACRAPTLPISSRLRWWSRRRFAVYI